MDVRCENCQVEYELDESKLKAGGVTVKCANCGHMFRIRKRVARNTAGGAGAVPVDPQFTKPRPKAPSGPPSVRKATPPAGVPPRPADKPVRKWLIRLRDGEVRTCHELAVLQQWIVAGTVTRDCHISRTGSTWKPLGQISELTMFFDIAEEAQQARRLTAAADPPSSRTTPSPKRPSTPPPVPQPATPAAGPTPPGAATVLGRPDSSTPPAGVKPPAEGKPAADGTPALAATLPASTPPAGVSKPVAGAGSEPAVLSGPKPSAGPAAAVEPAEAKTAAQSRAALARTAAAVPSGPVDERVTGQWAAAGAKIAPVADERGPVGPTGGLARGIPTTDVAFAANKNKPKLIEEERTEPSQVVFDDEDLLPPRSSIGKWIVIGSLVVIVVAAAAVFLGVFRSKDTGEERAGAEVAGDAGGVLATGLGNDAGGVVVSPAEDLIAEAYKAIYDDDREALVRVAGRLAKVADADTDLAKLVVRSRVAAALAQAIGDDARVDPEAAGHAKAEVKKYTASAVDLAEKAIAIDKNDVAANVAMADALRLQGKSAREVERWLKKAGQNDREAELVEALLSLRDNKLRQAKNLLTKLDGDGTAATTGDVRPGYQLALLDYNDKKYGDAKARLDSLFELHPAHHGGKLLARRIQAAVAVATTDPMPPEEHSGHNPSSGGDNTGGDSYDKLLAKADKKAETGDCKGASELYDRALDINPSGVGALTGLGYCHIEAKEFASAQSKFRAALVISPRYQDALLGVAEAYQQQGLEDKAVEAYNRFIEEHPTSPRAERARRQIEKLGGKVSNPGGPDDSGGTGGTGTSGSGTGGGTTGGGDTGGAGTGGGTGGASAGGTGGGASGGDTGGSAGGTGGGGDQSGGSGGAAGGDTGGGETGGSADQPTPAPEPAPATPPADEG